MLGAGDFFGEMMLIKEGQKAAATVRVPRLCEGYVLTKVGFTAVAREFPYFKALIKRVGATAAADRTHATFTSRRSLACTLCRPR